MKEKYLETHPWIKFEVDLREAPPELWMFLGEAASKCDHLAGVPLRPEVAQRLHLVYLAKGAAGTTAIEGNTLSEEQVLQHIQGELHLPPSQEYLQQEVDNIVRACNEIARTIVGPDENPAICRNLLCEFNRKVLEKLSVEDEVVPGELRTHSVIVGNVYRGAPAEDCSHLLDRLCEWLNTAFAPPKPHYAVPYAILKAVIAHLYIAWIHPFGDGNGRTARLLEFHLLLSAGLPLPAAHLLSDHYNKTKAEYYRQLDRASRSGGDIIPFITYALRGFVDGLRAQLEDIRMQQWQVAWENHVHQIFQAKSSEVQKRRRDLALDLGSVGHFVEIHKIADLTPRLARAYAKKTERTLLRDVKELEHHDLIVRRPGSIRARREIILAFLPARAMNETNDA